MKKIFAMLLVLAMAFTMVSAVAELRLHDRNRR